jgi:hypothetical protein
MTEGTAPCILILCNNIGDWLASQAFSLSPKETKAITQFTREKWEGAKFVQKTLKARQCS